MKISDFKESNATLLAPQNMNNCADLPCYKDGQYIISLWKPSLVERIKILFRGEIWLWVCASSTHPPVSLSAENPWEKKSE